MKYLDDAAQFVNSNGLAFHLDGARVFNAAVFHGVDVVDITERFDTVSCCFSKGLGAPLGSICVATVKPFVALDVGEN